MARVRPRPETARIRVLCIAATGQSGSTILSRLLGELPGFVAVGEIGRIWDKGLSENISCSCGDRFSLCSFWTAVGDAAFGGWDRVDGGEVAELRRSLAFEHVPLKHAMALPLITHPNLSPAYERWLDRYMDEMLAVYEAIHEVSGGQIIVDSMKIPSHIYMMALRMHGVDVRVVHQVRDSRGYAFSQTKFVARQGSLEHRPHRGRRSPWKSATRWNWVNASFDHLTHHRSVPGSRLRYEDLTADPNRALATIADVFGRTLRPKDLAFIHAGGAELGPGHIASGSRGRMHRGVIRVREDRQWIDHFSARDRRLVTAATAPLLRRYGYRLVGSPFHRSSSAPAIP